MKVNYNETQVGTEIRSVSVGDTFLAKRTTHNLKCLYMKVDGCSGLVRNTRGKSYAVNLVTGQLREFNSDALVEKVYTEVNFPKK